MISSRCCLLPEGDLKRRSTDLERRKRPLCFIAHTPETPRQVVYADPTEYALLCPADNPRLDLILCLVSAVERLGVWGSSCRSFIFCDSIASDPPQARSLFMLLRALSHLEWRPGAHVIFARRQNLSRGLLAQQAKSSGPRNHKLCCRPCLFGNSLRQQSVGESSAKQQEDGNSVGSWPCQEKRAWGTKKGS